MSCEAVMDLLSPYLDDELTDLEMRSVREHLARCACCRQQLARLQRVGGLFAVRRFVQPPPAFSQAVAARIYRRQLRYVILRSMLKLLLGLIVLAACVTIPATLFSSILTSVSDSPAVLIAVVAVFVSILDAMGTTGRAVGLALRLLAPGPTWATLLVYGAMAVLLTYGWARLVLRSASRAMNVQQSVG